MGARTIAGGTLRVLGYAVWAIAGVWAFILEIAIVYALWGFGGVVFGFIMLPVVFIAAPWYAGVALGNWLPLLLGYGGVIVGGILCRIADTLEERPW